MGRPNHHTTRIDANPPRYRTCDSHRIRLAQRLLNPSRAFYSIHLSSPILDQTFLSFPSFNSKRLSPLLVCFLLQNYSTELRLRSWSLQLINVRARALLQGGRFLRLSYVSLGFVPNQGGILAGGRVRVPTAETTSRGRKRFASILVSLGWDWI